MLLDVALGAFGAVLALFLPGFLLTWAVWPRPGALHADHDVVVRAGLGLLASLFITLVVALALSSLSALTRPALLWSLTGVAAAAAVGAFFATRQRA